MKHVLLLLTLAAPAVAAPKATGLPAEKVQPLWKRKVGDSAGPVRLEVVDDTLLVVSWDGELVALRAGGGQVAWRQAPARKNAGWRGNTQLAVAGGTAVVAWPGDAQVEARAPATGKVAWTRALEGPVTSVAACRGHALVAATHRAPGPDGATTLVATALEPATGNPLWRVPVEGELVGGGGGMLVAAKPSGFGAHVGQLYAIRCADGLQAAMPGMGRPYVTFFAADAGRVLALHHGVGRGNGLLCVHTVGGEPRCVDPAAHGGEGYPVADAALIGDRLYWSVAHVTAHNLDPSPDAWLFAVDLSTGELAARSEALTASAGPVDAGALLLTAFGSTGIDDFAYLLDPADLRRVRTLPTATGPNVLAADAERGYVATYDGTVYAMKLPLPGPAPIAEQPVAPQAMPVAAPKAAESLGWTLERVIDAHPKRAETSGQKTEGTVSDVAFLGPDGTLLATGGNDDRARVFSLADGKEIWKSAVLGKDVTAVAGCAEDRFAARTYDGKLLVFGRARPESPYVALATIKHGHGWMFGFDAGCGTVVSDDFDPRFSVYDARSGRKITVIEGSVGLVQDLRGLRVEGPTVVLPVAGAFQRYDVSDPETGPRSLGPVTLPADSRQPNQIWAPDGDSLVLEHCAVDGCTVHLQRGDQARTLRFDTRGGVWMASVPSTLELSPEGRFLLFHRDGLDMVIVEVETGARQVLGQVPRSMASTPSAAFSPDGKRLAVAMQPAPHQVTIYRLTR